MLVDGPSNNDLQQGWADLILIIVGSPQKSKS